MVEIEFCCGGDGGKGGDGSTHLPGKRAVVEVGDDEGADEER